MINRDFKIVFQPHNRQLYNGRRRFGIGAGKIETYVGHHNAKVSVERAIRLKEPQRSDSKKRWLRVKLPAHGIIDFYIQ